MSNLKRRGKGSTETQDWDMRQKTHRKKREDTTQLCPVLACMRSLLAQGLSSSPVPFADLRDKTNEIRATISTTPKAVAKGSGASLGLALRRFKGLK